MHKDPKAIICHITCTVCSRTQHIKSCSRGKREIVSIFSKARCHEYMARMEMSGRTSKTGNWSPTVCSTEEVQSLLGVESVIQPIALLLHQLNNPGSKVSFYMHIYVYIQTW